MTINRGGSPGYKVPVHSHLLVPSGDTTGAPQCIDVSRYGRGVGGDARQPTSPIPGVTLLLAVWAGRTDAPSRRVIAILGGSGMPVCTRTRLRQVAFLVPGEGGVGSGCGVAGEPAIGVVSPGMLCAGPRRADE